MRGAAAPVVLVAHSLACILVAHWARRGSVGRIGAAMLVAAPDADARGFPPEARSFAPMPLDRLPFPTTLVASSDDSYCTIERARLFASHWAAQLVEIGAQGHINTASGHGDWPEGERMLAALLARSQSSPNAAP